jgi:hypothetical protein
MGGSLEVPEGKNGRYRILGVSEKVIKFLGDSFRALRK